jgi:hypothetical protein
MTAETTSAFAIAARLMHSLTAFEESSTGSRLQGCHAALDRLASTVEILERAVKDVR